MFVELAEFAHDLPPSSHPSLLPVRETSCARMNDKINNNVVKVPKSNNTIAHIRDWTGHLKEECSERLDTGFLLGHNER